MHFFSASNYPTLNYTIEPKYCIKKIIIHFRKKKLFFFVWLIRCPWFLFFFASTLNMQNKSLTREKEWSTFWKIAFFPDVAIFDYDCTTFFLFLYIVFSRRRISKFCQNCNFHFFFFKTDKSRWCSKLVLQTSTKVLHVIQ